MAALTTRGERQLAILEQERKTDSDSKQAIWVFLWTLFIFKIATVLVILYAAKGTHEAQALMLATTWFWFLIPAVAIGGPLVFWRRMLKQRARREELRKSEWDVPEYTAPANRIVLATSDEGPNLA